MNDEMMRLATWAVQLIVTLMLGVIGYFAKATFERLKLTEGKMQVLETRLAVAEQGLARAEKDLRDDLGTVMRRVERIEGYQRDQGQTLSGILSSLDAIHKSVDKQSGDIAEVRRTLSDVTAGLARLEGK